jgi:para-nitrobenzyl esterase
MFSFDSLATSSWAAGPNGKADATDAAVARRVNSCWVAFYKMDPKSKSLSCAGGFTWPAYTDEADDAAQFTNAGPKLAKAKTLPSGPPQN